MTTTNRRLAAIAVIDVVGYSTMMAQDEEGTHAALKAHRNDIDPILLNHGCRVVKSTGDGYLVEIPSVVEALQAAVEIQQLMAERNASVAKTRSLEVRIGINLGDIIIDDDGDIYGDGVNVAARLEGLADPGGICVSESVRQQVGNRLEVGFEDMGEVEVKNIPDSVRAWRVMLDGHRTPVPRAKSGDYRLATVAVLPFDNMSGSGDDEYLADGITEDLITALARYRDLRVLARNSTFVYKGEAHDIRHVARELDATHVVEGSVRRAGERIRITAQLIEADGGHHIWAERFDRELSDVFELQDEIVHEIAGRVHPALDRAEGEKRPDRPSELDVWELFLRGRWHFNASTREELIEAIPFLEAAIERDPAFVDAYSFLGACWFELFIQRWRMEGRRPIEEFAMVADELYRIAPGDGAAAGMLAMAEANAGEFDHASHLARNAVELAPDQGMVLLWSGGAWLRAGDFDEAIQWLSKAWRAAEHEPWRHIIAAGLAFAHYLEGHYDAALAWGLQGTSVAPDSLQLWAITAASLGQLGRAEEARPYIGFMTADRPDLTVERFARNLRWRRERDMERYFEGLRKAGLPE
jgi:adenylate cyclase